MNDLWQWIKCIFLKFNRANVPYKVSFTNDEVCHKPPVRRIEYIKWKELQQVLIIKTEDGPELPDLWLGLIGKSSYCLIPFSAHGFTTVFKRVSRLKGFKTRKLLKLRKINGHIKINCWSIKTSNSAI